MISKPWGERSMTPDCFMPFTEKDKFLEVCFADNHRERKKLPLFSLNYPHESLNIFFAPMEQNPPKSTWEVNWRINRISQPGNVTIFEHTSSWEETFVWERKKKCWPHASQSPTRRTFHFPSSPTTVMWSLWNESSYKIIKNQYRGPGRQRALGTHRGCEKDINLQNSTQCSTSAMSSTWIHKSQPSTTKAIRMSISCINTIHTTHWLKQNRLIHLSTTIKHPTVRTGTSLNSEHHMLVLTHCPVFWLLYILMTEYHWATEVQFSLKADLEYDNFYFWK